MRNDHHPTRIFSLILKLGPGLSYRIITRIIGRSPREISEILSPCVTPPTPSKLYYFSLLSFTVPGNLSGKNRGKNRGRIRILRRVRAIGRFSFAVDRNPRLFPRKPARPFPRFLCLIAVPVLAVFLCKCLTLRTVRRQLLLLDFSVTRNTRGCHCSSSNLLARLVPGALRNQSIVIYHSVLYPVNEFRPEFL